MQQFDRATLVERLRRLADDETAIRQMLPRPEGNGPVRALLPPAGAPPARQGAVLVLLYPDGHDWCIPLTVRHSDLRHHSGEVSLPGGRYDETDGSLEQTALREAWEELGIPPAAVEVITTLTQFWIPVSNFVVLPVVALAEARPTFVASAGEVATILEARLSELVRPEVRRQTTRVIRGQPYDVPFFDVAGHEVWGATSFILSQLLNRLQA